MKSAARLLLLFGVAVGLCGCTTISTRIQEKAPVFESLDPNTRAKIAHGDVDLGYTPDMVYIALGAPDGRRQKISGKGATETWIYRAYETYGYYPMWDRGFHGDFFAGHHGRNSRGYGGFRGDFYGGGWPRFHGVRHKSDDDTKITFQNGRVTSIDRPGKWHG